MSKERKYPVTLKVNIEPEALKRVVEEGRLSDFVNAFPALAAGHIKAQIVEQLAKGKDVSMEIGYVIDDDDFYPGPQPMPYIDTVPLPESRWGLRRIVRDELERIRKF